MSDPGIIVVDTNAAGSIVLGPGEVTDWNATYTFRREHDGLRYEWRGIRPVRIDEAGSARFDLPPCKPGNIVHMRYEAKK